MYRSKLVLGFCIFIFSCQSTDNTRGQTNILEADTADTISLADTVAMDSSLLVMNEPAKDPFEEKVESITPLLEKWGFELVKDDQYDDLAAYKRHWWLKVFHHRSLNSRLERLKIDSIYLPTATDYSNIKSIRQFTFEKTWNYVIEEWQLNDQSDARRWLKIAVKTRRIDGLKPPRVYWVEGDKMYFIIATAARDWSENSHELIKAFTGRERWLIELFNQPLDLEAYKALGGANSSSMKGQSYYWKPDTNGHFYRYFWFHKLRRRSDSDDSFHGLEIKTYVHGEEIGYYTEVVEDLLGVRSRLQDRDLKSLNLVNKPFSELSDHFGLKKIPSDTLVTESHDGDILIVHLKNDTVDWFNFIRTTLDLKTDPLPNELKYYFERTPK